MSVGVYRPAELVERNRRITALLRGDDMSQLKQVEMMELLRGLQRILNDLHSDHDEAIKWAITQIDAQHCTILAMVKHRAELEARIEALEAERDEAIGVIEIGRWQL